MTFLTDLTHNIIFMSAITGWFVAQVLKTIIHIIVNKQFVAERLVGGGVLILNGSSGQAECRAPIRQRYVHLQQQPESGMVAEALNLHWRRSLQLW